MEERDWTTNKQEISLLRVRENCFNRFNFTGSALSSNLQRCIQRLRALRIVLWEYLECDLLSTGVLLYPARSTCLLATLQIDFIAIAKHYNNYCVLCLCV